MTMRPAAAFSANTGRGPVAARLGALHRSSGALTHDLNNFLGVITGATERLASGLPEGGEDQKLALLALEAAERGGELLRRTLALGRDADPQDEPIDCAAATKAVRRMAREAIPPGIRFKVAAPTGALHCAGDRTGLEMALLNLCLNAGHATPVGGAITLEVRRVRLGRGDRAGLAPGAYVAFTVRDSGAGMSPETLARATDPLFTTKAAGTGLGLSSVLDFAADAGGALALRSREGHGTTATLYLPLAAPAPSAAAA